MDTGGRVTALQLGRDHRGYGTCALGRPSPGCAWAMSIGATPDTPSLRFKGDPEFANEDALFVAKAEGRTLLAVADAHFGLEPSHLLMEALATGTDPIPATEGDLFDLLRGLADQPPHPEVSGGTSLLVAVYDHRAGRGFGASWFDSTLAVVGPGGHHRPVQSPGTAVVYLEEPITLHPDRADWFAFAAGPEDLILAYTDGVDCCHYRHPETSVTPARFERLYREVGGEDPERYLRALVELALAGVDGNPGGQDNIAAIAVRGAP